MRSGLPAMTDLVVAVRIGYGKVRFIVIQRSYEHTRTKDGSAYRRLLGYGRVIGLRL
jgi:hypothetical protein